MANAKVAQTPSPFSHELNVSGTACASDCPACRWVELRRRQEKFLELLLPRAHARLLEAKLKPLSIIAALLFVFAFGVSAHAQKLPTLHDIETAQPHAGLDEYVTLSNCAAWSNKLPVDPSIAF